MPYEPPPELAALSLSEIAERIAERKLPPVSQWQPQVRGDSQMRIAADGRWYHEGGEIRRPAMVRAFASLLRREDDGSHWLVTPGQMLSIKVEDAPLIAIDLKREGRDIAFRINTDDLVIAGPEHPIVRRGDPETPALYICVREGIEARLDRSTYAQLIEIALEQSEGPGDIVPEDLAVTSGGTRFALLPA